MSMYTACVWELSCLAGAVAGVGLGVLGHSAQATKSQGAMCQATQAGQLELKQVQARVFHAGGALTGWLELSVF